MNSIDIKGSIFEQYISPEQIKECVKNIAARINTDYQGKSTPSIYSSCAFYWCA